MIVAVDGPAAAGKGTLARRLAQHFGLRYLDTGSLYRAVGSKVLREKVEPALAASSLAPEDLAAPDLRSEAVGQMASKVAALPEVSSALLDYQRSFAATPPGAVLDGRDIGTVVCPDAPVKLFVTASAEARAHRRYLELRAKNPDVSEAAVLVDLRERDARDSGRATAPLKPAADAHLLDTTNLDIEAAFAAARDIIAMYR